MPAAAVILNSYNQAHWLPYAIDSVLGQTLEDIELIAVDNGSTDDSQEIMRGYADDHRVRLVLHHDNVSIGTRFNAAVAMVTAPCVTFLYSDDYFLPGKLKAQAAELERRGAACGVVYGPTYFESTTTGQRWMRSPIRKSGSIFPDLMRLSAKSQIDMSTPLIRRECLELHPFDETVFAEGEAIFFRIALTHEFAYLDEPFMVLRDHGQNAGKAIVRNRDLITDALAKLRVNPHLRPDDRPLIDFYESSLHRNFGWQGARLMADDAWTRSCFAAAYRVRPKSVLHPRVAAGLALTALPVVMRQRVNALGHRLRRSGGQPLLVDDYVTT